jgi:ribonuclease Z
MLTRLKAGALSVVGVSVGGVYTALSVPELSCLFDVGIAPRSFVGQKQLFISHGHADHVGSLLSLLGIHGLGKVEPPTLFLPREIEADVREAIEAFNRAQGRGVPMATVAMDPGEERELHGGLWVRAFRTLHTVPSLGYRLFRRVAKLKAEFAGLAGEKIRELRGRGLDMFDTEERTEFAYATDTLIDVLDRNPELYAARVLALECTFLDHRKGRGDARAKGHVHWDEIVERAELFRNDHLVLMHFSQLYSPSEVRDILARTCPPGLAQKLLPFAPERGPWPG